MTNIFIELKFIYNLALDRGRCSLLLFNKLLRFSNVGVLRGNTCKQEFRPRTRIPLIRSSVHSSIRPSIRSPSFLPLLFLARTPERAFLMHIPKGPGGAGSGNLYGSPRIHVGAVKCAALYSNRPPRVCADLAFVSRKLEGISNAADVHGTEISDATGPDSNR